MGLDSYGSLCYCPVFGDDRLSPHGGGTNHTIFITCPIADALRLAVVHTRKWALTIQVVLADLDSGSRVRCRQIHRRPRCHIAMGGATVPRARCVGLMGVGRAES